MCGATPVEPLGLSCSWGLSPRVRGNLGQRIDRAVNHGPIPACAGQPWTAIGPALRFRAYPRVCGATEGSCVQDLQFQGLSPRVRGNHHRPACRFPGTGPIPACAGQPNRTHGPGLRRRAYPRVCGATAKAYEAGEKITGLSPRVRGNLGQRADLLGHLGPIPACAGQPASGAVHPCLFRAYPRVCGATDARLINAAPDLGLSPRVRGNLCIPCCPIWTLGPIPACAGQPQHHSIKGSAARAYPRVCGATDGYAARLTLGTGLSPRVRGNL